MSCHDLSDSLIESMLHDLANGLSDNSFREMYRDESLTQRELLEVLQHVSEAERSEFVVSVIERAKHSPAAARFLDGKLGNIMHFMTVDEKAELVQSLMESADTYKYAARVLSSGADLEEIAAMVQTVGVEGTA